MWVIVPKSGTAGLGEYNQLLTKNYLHTPVLLHEVVDGLNITANQIYFDCTVGSAGHAVEIAGLGGQVVV